MRPLPGATTRELVVHLSTSSVCPSPAFIAMTSCVCLIAPIFSCVAGSKYMDQNTLRSAPRRPPDAFVDRYERPAAADHTSCSHIASFTLGVWLFLMAVAPFPASLCTGHRRGRYALCTPHGLLAAVLNRVYDRLRRVRVILGHETLLPSAFLHD